MNANEQEQTVLVWDFPVRVFHWLLVVSFAGAWLTSESEAQQMLHYAFGYSACLLVVCRLLWGIVGTRYARFSQFMKSPAETIRHFKSLLSREKHLGLGHNPAGAWAMLALMVLILLIGITGYLNVKELYGDAMEEAHELLANIILGVVAIHVFAAVVMGWWQKENLVLSMLTGKKQGHSGEGITSSFYLVGLGLLLAWALCFYLIVSGALPALTQ